MTDDAETIAINGFQVTVAHEIGWISVDHDGAIKWDDLQAIKNAVWGEDARAIEVYPRSKDVINNGNHRHLWRLGDDDFCPDMLGHNGDTLAQRSARVWGAADH